MRCALLAALLPGGLRCQAWRTPPAAGLPAAGKSRCFFYYSGPAGLLCVLLGVHGRSGLLAQLPRLQPSKRTCAAVIQMFCPEAVSAVARELLTLEWRAPPPQAPSA